VQMTFDGIRCRLLRELAHACRVLEIIVGWHRGYR
jgi:hypothetical protein